MFGNDGAADKALQKLVSRRLERTGAQSGLAAAVQRGVVTLSGKLRNEASRLSIVKALRGVPGVRNVIDQLVSPPKRKLEFPTRPVQPVATRVASNDAGLLPESANGDGQPAGDHGQAAERHDGAEPVPGGIGEGKDL